MSEKQLHIKPSWLTSPCHVHHSSLQPREVQQLLPQKLVVYPLIQYLSCKIRDLDFINIPTAPTITNWRYKTISYLIVNTAQYIPP
jgi:hypothetical protein